MRDKILLEVCLPAAEKSFDIRIPRQLKAAQAVSMLVDFFSHKEEGYIPTGESVLCDMETGRVIDSNMFIDTAGLHNGSKVMLL